MSAMDNYQALLNKTDAKSAEIVARYPDKINCGRGCHTCCIRGLTVNGIERASIKKYLETRPQLLLNVRENVKNDPHHGQRCSFLDEAGSCMIYEVRPIVCRSHGMPLKIKPELGSQEAKVAQNNSSSADELDVCPLNFTDMALADVGSHYFISLETLNTILVLLNQQFDLKNAEKRHLLTPDGVMLPTS